MIDVGRVAALHLPVLADHLPGAVGNHQHGGHAEVVGDREIARQVLEHRRAGGIDPVPVEKAPVGARRGLRLQFGGDDVEHRLEMVRETEPRQHLAGVVGRAVGQDQLAAGQGGDRRPHRRVGLQRRVVDPVDIGKEVVGGDAVLGHHAAHRGAEALVVVLLDAEGFLGRYVQRVGDVIANPPVDLLPQVDVMGIQRVVEIEHPGLDIGEAAAGFRERVGHRPPICGSACRCPDW